MSRVAVRAAVMAAVACAALGYASPNAAAGIAYEWRDYNKAPKPSFCFSPPGPFTAAFCDNVDEHNDTQDTFLLGRITLAGAWKQSEALCALMRRAWALASDDQRRRVAYLYETLCIRRQQTYYKVWVLHYLAWRKAQRQIWYRMRLNLNRAIEDEEITPSDLPAYYRR